MADNYEIDLEIEGGEQPDLVMNVQGGEQPELNLQTEGGATDGASARNAEAWANGTRNGVPVTEGDPAYHNNSKYYRDSAAAIVAGDVIDDDAGIGDYDLTWSADKLAGEFEGKATAIGVTDTESAAVKTIPDGADGMTMGVTIGIEPVQAGNGDPSPSNVREISARSSVEVTNGGGDFFDANGTATQSTNTTVTVNGKNSLTVATVGNGTYKSSLQRLADYNLEVGKTYKMHAKVTQKSANAYAEMSIRNSSNQIKAYWNFETTQTNEGEFTFTYDPTIHSYFSFFATMSTSATGSVTYDDITLEEIEDTNEIEFPSTPGTVLGGSLTINKDGTGKIVVDTVMRSWPAVTTINTSAREGSTGKYISWTNNTYRYYQKDSEATAVFEKAKSIPADDRGQAWEAYIASYNTVAMFVPSDSTVESVNAVVEGMKFAIRLESPVQTYSLTAAQVNAIIKSRKGNNVIFADSGKIISVDYSADTKLYVDEHNETEDAAITSIKGMIADSDAPVATASHAIGDVFICGNELLRATSVIVAGETISTGTGGNAETISLAEYIAEKATAIAGVQSNVDLLEEKAIALGLSPMNRRIFQNYNKGMQPGTGANLRYVDVLFNTIRSEGHDLTGSTYRGVLMTSANGARLPGVNLNSDFTMYKSDFKPINTPTLQSGPAKFVVHVTQSGNNNGNTAVPITMFYTYDTNGHIKKTLFGAPAANGSYDMDWYYIMPDEFKTNKNICIGTNFRSPKQSIDMKIEFMFLLESIIPESIQTLTIDDTNMTVQDDPT